MLGVWVRYETEQSVQITLQRVCYMCIARNWPKCLDCAAKCLLYEYCLKLTKEWWVYNQSNTNQDNRQHAELQTDAWHESLENLKQPMFVNSMRRHIFTPRTDYYMTQTPDAGFSVREDAQLRHITRKQRAVKITLSRRTPGQGVCV